MSEVADANGGTRHRSAFVFFAHRLFPRLEQQIAEARRELAGIADVHVVGYFDDAAQAPPEFAADPSFHAYEASRIEALGYPFKAGPPFQIMPGNCDAVILAFAQDHPHYETIWQFEYDVVFTGLLVELVGAFAGSSSDLLCTNLAPISRYWWHRRMNRDAEGWPPMTRDLLRGFLPVFRVSRRFLDRLDAFYRAGGAGHHEVTWPHVAQASGLGIEDIGGSGRYVKRGNRNRFYRSTPAAQTLYPGTFRWRPLINRVGRRRSTLWHPVKETPEPLSWSYFDERLRYLSRWRWVLIDRNKL